MPSVKPRVAFAIHCYLDDPASPSLWQNATWMGLFSSIDQSLYPTKGLWPDDDADLPCNLTRAESNAIKDFITAAATIFELDGVSKVCQFQVDCQDEYSAGRRALAQIFDSLIKMAKIHDKIYSAFLEQEYHPAMLAESGVTPIVKLTPCSRAVAILAKTLWGQMAVDRGCGIIYAKYSLVAMAFMIPTWRRLKITSDRWIKIWRTKVQEMEAMYRRLEEPNITRTEIRKALHMGKEHLATAKSMHDQMVYEKAELHVAKLKGLIHSCDRKRSPTC